MGFGYKGSGDRDDIGAIDHGVLVLSKHRHLEQCVGKAVLDLLLII